jgi:hypothetical protein
MSRRTILALRFTLIVLVVGSCTKGAGFVDSFGSSYTAGGDGSGHDTGDEDDEGGEGSPTGPLDDGGEDPSAGDDAPPGPPGSGDCCEGQVGPGCGDATIEGCVCAQDSFCCEDTWDELCAKLVVDNMCGLCDGPGGDAGSDGGDPSTDGGDPSTDGGDPSTDDGGSDGVGDDGGGSDEGGGDDGGLGNCCSAHAGTGCTAPAVEACVCGEDGYCCDTDWDDVCAGEVDSFGCAACGGGGTDDGAAEDGTDAGAVEDGGDDGGGGDCCVERAVPGCSDAEAEACVCGQDDYCCATAWDDVCVGEVDSLGCGSCGGVEDGGTDEGGVSDGGGTDDGGGTVSECCTAQGGPGCASEPELEACVCAGDSWCCDVEWDDLCAGEVASFGCGAC